MVGRRLLALAMAAAATVTTASGCAREGTAAEEARRRPPSGPLEPHFAPETTVASLPDAGGGETGTPASSRVAVPEREPVRADGNQAASTTVGRAPAGGEPAVGERGSTVETGATSSFADPVGDLTPSADAAPAWADLAGGRLTRTPDGFELRTGLGGGKAPDRAPDERRTMNIASFFDLDGDGRVEVQIWANISEEGWYPAYYTPEFAGPNRFGDESGVTIRVDGPDLVLAFPVSHLGGAERFRWSLASEWGPYETIGTDLAARDDAPDHDQAAAFPS